MKVVMTGTATKWVIVKDSRSGAGRMYKGSSWEQVGVEVDSVPEYFDSLSHARYWADKLTEINLVGFHAERFKKEVESGDSSAFERVQLPPEDRQE